MHAPRGNQLRLTRSACLNKVIYLSNSVTIGQAHPLPRVDDILDSLEDAQYFSTLDLKSAYWQIFVDEKDRLKTGWDKTRIRNYGNTELRLQ